MTGLIVYDVESRSTLSDNFLSIFSLGIHFISLGSSMRVELCSQLRVSHRSSWVSRIVTCVSRCVSEDRSGLLPRQDYVRIVDILVEQPLGVHLAIIFLLHNCPGSPHHRVVRGEWMIR